MAWWRRALIIVTVVWLACAAQPSSVRATGTKFFAQTGFGIDDPQFSDYFDSRGGVPTFGYPVSWEFRFLGFPVQIFQRAILQRYPDGHVQLLNLLDPGLFPLTQVNGAILPPVDSSLTSTAPPVGSANYGSAVITWIDRTSPDVWNGLPVGFHRTFVDTVSPASAGARTGQDLEVWGVPTSTPAFDPNNHAVVYQRFQRGVLQYDGSCGCTHALLLADYFKAVLLGGRLPPDLQAEVSASRFLGQYQNGKAGSLSRPDQLPNTDLTGAFDRAVVDPTSGSSIRAPRQIGSILPPVVDATSIAVIDETSGALLYGKSPHLRLPPASVTKIFTTLVALRYGDLNQNLAVSFDPSQLTDSTLMGIHPGETYSLENLLYGLMLPSGNDAALAIANGVGGTTARFVSLMNAQAADLGLVDSHFENPHGLDAPGHFTSAYDLAMAARYGMTHYSEFRRLAAARSWTVQGSRTFTLYNLNRFLRDYSGADGVKIGYTDAAGKTIVASATRNGHRVYVVLLHCHDIVADSVPLFDWVFGNFAW